MLRDCMIQVLYCPVHMGPMGAMVEGTMDDLKGLVNPWIHRGAYNGAVAFVGSPRRGVPYRSLATDDLYALCEAGYLDINEFEEEDEHGDCGV